jgi:ABC-type multidrug transport system fused ATPase/permease subunit
MKPFQVFFLGPTRGFFELVPKSFTRKIMLLTLALSLLGLIEVLNVLLVSAIISSSVNLGSDKSGMTHFINNVVEQIPFLPKEPSERVPAVAILFFCLFVTKTLLSLFFMNSIVRTLAASAGLVSKKLTKDLFSGIEFFQKGQSQRYAHAINVSPDFLLINYLGAKLSLISECISLGLIVMALVALDWFAAIVISFTLLVAGLVQRRLISRRLFDVNHEIYSELATLNQKFIEFWALHKEVYLSGKEDFVSERIEKNRKRVSSARIVTFIFPTLGKYLMETAAISVVFLMFILQMFVGELESAVSSLIIGLIALSRMAPAAIRIQQSGLQMRAALGGGNFSLDFMTEVGEVVQNQLGKKEKFQISSQENPITEAIAIAFDNVTFSYPNSENRILDRVSFEIGLGEFIGIVGKSGIGKTTLLDLVLGYQEPQEGNIVLFGISPRDFVKNFPGAIAYVPQKVYLFNGSLAENITLQSKDELDLVKLERVTMQSQLLEWILSLPDGFDTQVDETRLLSAGQIQRIGIARALYSEPKILLIDEGTNALDLITRNLILSVIENLNSDSVVIAVSHDSEQWKRFSGLIFLDEGHTESIGLFENFMTSNTNFQDLVKIKSQDPS